MSRSRGSAIWNRCGLPGAKEEAVGEHENGHRQKHKKGTDPEERAVMNAFPPRPVRLASI
jgi:hypothetical protein